MNSSSAIACWLVRLVALLALTIAIAACNSPPVESTSPVAEPTASVDIMAGGIEGVVRDPDGNPIQGALVLIRTTDFRGTATTTEEGTFTARGVSGRFVIEISGLEWQGQSREVTVEPGEMVTVEFTLQPLNG